MNSNKQKSTFISSALFFGAIGVIIKALGAVYKIILGREAFYGTLGASNVAFVYPYYNLLLALSTVGITSAVAKIISTYDVRGEMQEKENMFRLVRNVMIVVGIFFSVFLYLVSPIICNTADFSSAIYSMNAISLSVIFVSIMSAYRGYFQGHQNLKPFANSQLIEQLGKVVFGFIFAIIFLPMGVEYSAAGSLLGVSIGGFFGVLYLIYKRRRFVKEMGLPKPEKLSLDETKKGIKKIFYYAIPISIGASVIPLIGMIDSRLIKTSLMGLGYAPELAQKLYSYHAFYVMALVGFPTILFTAIQVSILPAVSSLVALNDYEKLRSTIRTGIKVVLIIAIAAAVGFFTLAKPIIALLWPSPASIAENAEPIMKIMGITLIFIATYHSTSGILQGLGRQMRNSLNLVIGITIKAIAAYYLLKNPSVGVIGAAISTLIGFIIAATLNVITLKKTIKGDNELFKDLIKPTISAIIMGAIVYGVYHLLSPVLGNSITTILSVLVGAGSYFVLLIYSKALNKADLEFIPGKKYLKRFVK